MKTILKPIDKNVKSCKTCYWNSPPQPVTPCCICIGLKNWVKNESIDKSASPMRHKKKQNEN